MSFTTPAAPTPNPSAPGRRASSFTTARSGGRTVLRTGRNDRMLRVVLGTNAVTSVAAGMAALLAGGALDALLDTGHPGWVRLVGAGLVVFGIAVAAVARSSTDVLVRWAPIVSVADAAWVVFTVVSIALGWYSTTGAVAMAVVGAIVVVFGVEQVAYARRLAADQRSVS